MATPGPSRRSVPTSESKPDMEVAKNGDIIIRMGFSSIQCDFYTEREVLWKEGKDLCHKNIFNVEETQKKSGVTVVDARCVRQMSKHQEPYFLHMTLDNQRKVLRGADKSRCSCQAGAVGLCKHFSALVQYINKERPVSKTGVTQVWNKPSEYSRQVMYPKGKPLYQIHGTKPAPAIDFSQRPSEESVRYTKVSKCHTSKSLPTFQG